MTVTYWKYPSAHQYLVLGGTHEETKEEAAQYFEDNPDSMTFREDEMSEEELEALPEFEG